MTAQASEPRPWAAWKIVLSTLVFLFIAAASFGGFGWLIFRGLESTGCSPDCRSEMYGTALWEFPALCAIVFFGGILATFLLRRRSWAWLLPVLGLVLMTIGFVAANFLINAAMLK